MILTSDDLLAISQVVDTRLDTRLKPMEQNIREIKVDVADLRADVEGLKVDVADLRVDVEGLKVDVEGLRVDVEVLKNNVQKLETGLHNVKLFQENIILPRLNTIESCYTDTYRCYQKNNDKMEAAFDDIDLLKKVVANHGEKLQKLA